MESAFFPWDPERPLKSHMCAKCSKPGTLRCSRCKVARYCSVECQREHHPSHKGLCKLGVEGYKRRVLQHIANVGAAARVGGGGEEAAVREYEEELEEARRMGDAEGERHLCKVLAHKMTERGDRERAAAYEGRAKVVEDVIGRPERTGLAADLERLVGGAAGSPGGVALPPPEELRRLLAGDLKLPPMGM